MMNGAPIRTRIVNASEQSLAEINRLIARSKSNWNWPKGYLDSALPLHRVNSVYLRSNHCFEVLDALDNLIAFFSVVVGEARVVLDNLWVTPELIGSDGLGNFETSGRQFRFLRRSNSASIGGSS
jgi:hypothetical protein